MEGQIARFLKSNLYWEFDKDYDRDGGYPETVIVDSTSIGLYRTRDYALAAFFRLARPLPLVDLRGVEPHDTYAPPFESAFTPDDFDGGVFPLLVIRPRSNNITFLNPHPFINSVEKRHMTSVGDELSHFLGGASLIFFEDDEQTHKAMPDLYSVKLTPSKLEFESRSSSPFSPYRKVECYIGFGDNAMENRVQFIPRAANVMLGEWKESSDGSLSTVVQNTTITHDPIQERYKVSILLTQRNIEDLVNVFRTYVYDGTKTLVTSKRSGGIMSLEFLQQYCLIANKVIQRTFDTPQEYFFLEYDRRVGTADIMVSSLGLKDMNPMQNVESIPFPIKKLDRLVFEKILREIRELEQISFRRRTTEQVRRLIRLSETAMHFQDVSFMDCQMCSANIGSHILNDAHVLCTGCAKMVQRPSL